MISPVLRHTLFAAEMLLGIGGGYGGGGGVVGGQGRTRGGY